MSDASYSNPSADSGRLVAYADLNCPFCYALEERLATRKVGTQIEWRLVEHAPDLPDALERATDHEQQELAQELDALVTRAPDVQIRRPPFRPRSGPAIRAVIAASRIHPAAAGQLRLSLFRALWLHGLNIADTHVIAEVASNCGLPETLDDSDCTAAAAAWTAEWRAAELNRIPCLISAANAKLLGLSTTDRLDLFLRSGLFGSQSDAACVTP